MFAVGFCASAFLLLVRAMIADVADEVKLEPKQDLTSLLFSMVTTTTKIGGQHHRRRSCSRSSPSLTTTAPKGR